MFVFTIGLFLLLPGTVSADIAKYEDFESGFNRAIKPCDYPACDWMWLTTTYDCGVASTNQARDGDKSLYINHLSANGGRCEYEWKGIGDGDNIDRLDRGEEHWIGFSVYFPVGPGDANDGYIIWQQQSVPDGCDAYRGGPALNLFVLDTDELMIRNRGASAACDSGPETSVQNSMNAVATDQWYDIVVHWDLTVNLDGDFEVWQNGVIVVDVENTRTSFNDTPEDKLKFGIYNNWIANPNPDPAQIYYDEIRLSTLNGSYCEVAPTIRPDIPLVTSPSNNENNVSRNPVLQADAYTDSRADLQNCFGHNASQWQITEYNGGSPDWESLTWDSGEDETNLTTISVSSVTLSSNTEYVVRVKYEALRNGEANTYWSDWSGVNIFTTGGADTTCGRCSGGRGTFR